MIQRKPEDRAALAPVAERLPYQRRVVQEIAMAEHHALGLGRGAGRVLEERRVPAVDPRILPRGSRLDGHLIGGDPAPLEHRPWHPGGRRLLMMARRAQDERGVRDFDDRLAGPVRAVAARWGNRHREDARIQAAEKRGDKVQSRRI
jgi:hypothetical protein